MDQTTTIDCPLNDTVESVNEEKREEVNEGESQDAAAANSVKKRKRDGDKEMQRVAEIVMVLSAMAAMRGGKKLTEAEVELMAEAREKLAAICEGLKPMDLVDRDGIQSVAEDLGFNLKVKDQKLGFREPPRMSVKERFSLTKMKMEETKKFAAPSATYSSHTTQPSFSAVVENRGSSLPSSGSPASLPLNQTLAATAAPVTHHPVTPEVRASTAAFRFPANQVGRDSFVSPQSQVKVNSSASHPLVTAPTWTRQCHPVQANMVPNHMPAKVQGTADIGVVWSSPQAARGQTVRPSITQSIPSSYPELAQPTQGVKAVQPSTPLNNHIEIAKLVQKILQPKIPENPKWTPPSREYMNKALTCQMCKLTVNEVEAIVVCDACERGFHLKCLEAINQKGIPRAEWHCMKCLSLSNGKPLPPKYGRVMRSIAQKGPSVLPGPQSSAEKKVGGSEPKADEDKVTASGSSSLHNPSESSTIGNNSVESTTGVKAPNEKDKPGSNTISGGNDVDKEKSAETLPTSSTKSVEGICNSTYVDASSDRSNPEAEVSGSLVWEVKSASESNLQPTDNASDRNSAEHQPSRPFYDSHTSNTELLNAEVPLDKKNLVEEFANAGGDCPSRTDIKQNEQLVHANSSGSSLLGTSNSEEEQPDVLSHNLRNVEWIGDIVKNVGEKTYYGSCRIDGLSYKLQDHALCPSNEKLMPLKLQAMWEDVKTGSKWVTVSWCYSPSNLPGAVGLPYTPERNEVYESNHESSVLAGMIQGPCDVLPPPKYKEWSEGLHNSGSEANSGERPVFLCKWFFDELKGTFQVFS